MFWKFSFLVVFWRFGNEIDFRSNSKVPRKMLPNRAASPKVCTLSSTRPIWIPKFLWNFQGQTRLPSNNSFTVVVFGTLWRHKTKYSLDSGGVLAAFSVRILWVQRQTRTHFFIWICTVMFYDDFMNISGLWLLVNIPSNYTCYAWRISKFVSVGCTSASKSTQLNSLRKDDESQREGLRAKVELRPHKSGLFRQPFSIRLKSNQLLC